MQFVFRMEMNQKMKLDKLQSKFYSLQIDDIPFDVVKQKRMDHKWAIMGKLSVANGFF